MKATIVLDQVEFEVDFAVVPAGSYPEQTRRMLTVHDIIPNLDDHVGKIEELLWEVEDE